MSDEREVRRSKGERNPVQALAHSYWKSRRSPVLTSQSDKRIAINSIYDFTTHALRRDLGFNPGVFEIETKDWDFAPLQREI
jgi:hypothetical protein